MRFMQWASDGGKDSGVMGFFLVEIKGLFSIVLLKFNKGSREKFHSHAFSAITWFLKGKVIEEDIDGSTKTFYASLWPKRTPRRKFHKIHSIGTTWALSIRGPWSETWQEWDSSTNEYTTLTYGRKIV